MQQNIFDGIEKQYSQYLQVCETTLRTKLFEQSTNNLWIFWNYSVLI